MLIFFLQNIACSFAILTQSMHHKKIKPKVVTRYPVSIVLCRRTMYKIQTEREAVHQVPSHALNDESHIQ